MPSIEIEVPVSKNVTGSWDGDVIRLHHCHPVGQMKYTTNNCWLEITPSIEWVAFFNMREQHTIVLGETTWSGSTATLIGADLLELFGAQGRKVFRIRDLRDELLVTPEYMLTDAPPSSDSDD